jgi:plasmid stabilization system protein ParE
MPYELLTSPTAFHETGNDYDHYEIQSPGLGERFLKSLEDAYQKLAISPQHYGYINSRKDIRDMKIETFPFIIVFQILEDQVLILRIFNTNRDPLPIKKL